MAGAAENNAAYVDACEDKMESQVNTYVEYERPDLAGNITCEVEMKDFSVRGAMQDPNGRWGQVEEENVITKREIVEDPNIPECSGSDNNLLGSGSKGNIGC